MTTSLIPRPMALLKLLALEPVAADQLHTITGWPQAEITAIVKNLHRHGLVTWRNERTRCMLHVGAPRRWARAERQQGARP